MVIVMYLDDILALGDAKECQENVNEVVSSLERLRFLINRTKSITEPSQIVLYLRLLWDLTMLNISHKMCYNIKLCSDGHLIIFLNEQKCSTWY